MKTSTKIYWLLVVFIIASATIVSEFTDVRQVGRESSTHTTNAGELTREVLVGQTFVSSNDKLSGVSVMFATYSGRNNTEPVEFHLRRSINDSTDLRFSSVMPDVLGDNQYYTFKFDPIVNSKDQTYFFFVKSPGSIHNDAVAVDLDTRDPYHLGTAYIARAPVGTEINASVLERSGKQTVDVVFQTYYTVSLRQYIVDSARSFVYWFIGTWSERQGNYFLWIKLAIAAVIFVVLVWLSRKESDDKQILSFKVARYVLLGLVLTGLLFRVMYAVNMPLTSDEGNYLYDARTLLTGHLAGGDGYVKAPLVIAWIALWQFILGHTILAGRIASVLAGTLTIFPIYLIGREMHNRYSGLLAAAAWALFGAPVVSTIYVHTQSVALFFGIWGVAIAWLALHNRIGKGATGVVGDKATSWRWFFLAGVLLGLGVASRKSVLALGVVPLMTVMVENRTWSARIKQLLAIGIGFSVVIALLLFAANKVYGIQGVWEVVGLNSAEDAVNADPAQADQVREYSIRGMTPFFRESLPLILLSILGWGISLEEVVVSITKRLFKSQPTRLVVVLSQQIIPKLVWILPILLFMWAWKFFFEYEGAVFLDMGGMRFLWGAFVVVIGLVALWPRVIAEVSNKAKAETSVTRSTQPLTKSSELPNVVSGARKQEVKERSWLSLIDIGLSQKIAVALLPFIWLVGLAFFYINWIKFHANYIVEFLPPLAIASGVGAYLSYQRLAETSIFIKPVRLIVRIGLVVVLLWAIYLSGYITYVYEHTGTFDLGSIKEAAAWAKQNIPMDQPIFTGAAVVPYLSGHHVALDIAHPRWYAYEFTRKNPERLSSFLPTSDKMLEAYRQAEWFLMDSQTSFSFLMEYSEIEAGLARDWVPVQGIENGSNSLTFYKRVK